MSTIDTVRKSILLLNGPPRSGKDTLAKLLETKYGFHHLKITSRWKERVHALYGMNPEQYPHDFFEETKDTPQAAFMGISPRQAYIKVWEDYFLPAHGENVLMDWLIDDIDNSPSNFIVISDLGFDREATYLFNYFGNTALAVKIFRQGFEYKNDSRGYIQRDSTKVKTRRGSLEYRIANIYNVNDKPPENMLIDFEFIWDAAFVTPLRLKEV